MDDKKLPLLVGGGTAALIFLAAVSALSDRPEPAVAVAEAIETTQDMAVEAAETVAETADAAVEAVEEVVETVADAVESAAETVTGDDETAEVESESDTETAQDEAAEETAEEEMTEVADADDLATDQDTSDVVEAVTEMPEEEAVADVDTAATDGFDFAAMTPEQSGAFGDQVRSYLLANPQVLQEMVSRLEEQEAASRAQTDFALVSANADALLDDGFSYVGGNPDGDITVVEFIDYRCGFCRRAAPELAELIQTDGNIRLIVKEFPILGEASLISSQFAIATLIAEGPEAYKAIHDGLVALEGDPTESALSRLASTLGLDADAIFGEMESDEVMRRIGETRQLAQAMQISGTPTFVFGDQMVRGYAPLDAMQQIVAQERASE